MALCYSHIAVDIREVVLRDKPPSMLRFSPKATVPVLVLADNTVMDESLDIMHWALRQNDPQGVLSGLSEASMEEACTLICYNDGPFKECLDRYKYADRYPRENAQHCRRQAEDFLYELDQRLRQQRYLAGETLSIADLAIFPFIRQFAFVDKVVFDQYPYRHLQTWLSDHLSSPLFTRSMHKLAPWRENDEPVVFPPALTEQ